MSDLKTVQAQLGEAIVHLRSINAVLEGLLNPKTLYSRTGDIKDINTMLVNRGELRALIAQMQRSNCPACEGNPTAPNNPCAVCGAAQMQRDAVQPDLHAAILNLPATPPDFSPAWAATDGYKIGHRDARHAAAELVAAPQPAPEPQQDQLQQPDGHSTPCVEAASTAPLPDDLIRFLNGEAPLDGVWFGEKHPTERGALWWRKHLPRVVEAQPGDQKQDDHAGSPAPSEPVARLLDHQIAGVVNHVTEIARKYHDTQQLRERIRGALGPLIAEVRYLRDAPSAESSKAALSDDEIDDVWRECEGYRPGHIAGRQAIEFARAILARAGIGKEQQK